MSSRIAMWVQLAILYGVVLSTSFLHVEKTICTLPAFPSEHAKVQYVSVPDEDLYSPDSDYHFLKKKEEQLFNAKALVEFQSRWGLLDAPPEQQPEMSQETPPASGESAPMTPLWLRISQAPRIEWIGQGQGRIHFAALIRFILGGLH